MNLSHIPVILLRVNNLDACRAFYRDVIGLGSPAMDSNFWVEFRCDTFSLCLEKCDWGEKIPPASGRIALIFPVDDIENFSHRMICAGYQPGADSSDRMGYPVKCYSDPEGNLFYVTEQKAGNA